MRIYLHIGLEHVGAGRLQDVLAEKREQLAQKGILFPRALGPKNHTRLYMAVTDPDHIDPLRFNRGYMMPEKQAALYDEIGQQLARDIEATKPHTIILSASQLGASLHRVSELERLRALLLRFSQDIRIIAHIDEQARLLVRHYSEQVMEGRGASLDLEIELAGTSDWWDDCLPDAHKIEPDKGRFIETQTPAFWLDYARLQEFWEGTFGAGSLSFRPYDPDLFWSENVTEELRAMFGIEEGIGRANPARHPNQYSAAWVARGRQLNELLLHVLGTSKRILPRALWRKFMNEIQEAGDPIDPASLSDVSKTFEPMNKALLKAHPALTEASLKRDRAKGTWAEAVPGRGYRASQYLLSFLWRIDSATVEARKEMAAELARLKGTAAPVAAVTPAVTPTAAPSAPVSDVEGLSPQAKAIMPPLAIQNFEKLRHSSFKPHNKLGMINEEELAAPYAPMQPHALPSGRSGNVIVGCMKNEAPYILEWVAYHRAMGVDNFLIYTNGCEDGTAELLDHLMALGHLQHRDNADWKGNSPQQYALNKSLKEPVIMNADWIIHIDVDEFINVRCGNGTLDDFFARVPDATNVAMTWRLFGHNGVTTLADELVIDQFDHCAPKFCPKPHTVWGFKTMFKNVGAYEKISCHRPNKLDDAWKDRVKWVNGSGKDMTKEASENGWRNSVKSIGYDLLQLNHYALRSAESFLVKRQRGRALHVDRSIGLNYWIRMDWSDHRDVTIKRNIPRVRAELDRLLADPELRKWHEYGYKWHQDKAAELHASPEFQELYDQAVDLKLTTTEHVAYALALDMES